MKAANWSTVWRSSYMVMFCPYGHDLVSSGAISGYRCRKLSPGSVNNVHRTINQQSNREGKGREIIGLDALGGRPKLSSISA